MEGERAHRVVRADDRFFILTCQRRVDVCRRGNLRAATEQAKWEWDLPAVLLHHQDSEVPSPLPDHPAHLYPLSLYLFI
jgi:hypothetical protein